MGRVPRPAPAVVRKLSDPPVLTRSPSCKVSLISSCIGRYHRVEEGVIQALVLRSVERNRSDGGDKEPGLYHRTLALVFMSPAV